MSHSPSDIEVMLHYYYSVEPHPRRNAPAVANAINQFADDGLLEYDANSEAKYKATERGRAWVEMICATPYPEQAWLDPRNAKSVEQMA